MAPSTIIVACSRAYFTHCVFTTFRNVGRSCPDGCVLSSIHGHIVSLTEVGYGFNCESCLGFLLLCEIRNLQRLGGISALMLHPKKRKRTKKESSLI